MGHQKFSIPPKNTLVSMEENKETRIDIDPEYSSDSLRHIYKSLGHHYHLEKENGVWSKSSLPDPGYWKAVGVSPRRQPAISM